MLNTILIPSRVYQKSFAQDWWQPNLVNFRYCSPTHSQPCNSVLAVILLSDIWSGTKSLKSKLSIICHLTTQEPYLKAICHVMMCHRTHTVQCVPDSDQKSERTIQWLPVTANEKRDLWKIKINPCLVVNVGMKIISMISWYLKWKL